ncbi:hypothetical protein LV779_30760 [Streptomyces thinghirensis]|nr:hypothetical protein [Streptomyces thinghirensis]
MSARTTRRTRLFAATTVALAALALTACEGDGSDTGAPAGSSSVPAGDQAKPSTGGSESDGERNGRRERLHRRRRRHEHGLVGHRRVGHRRVGHRRPGRREHARKVLRLRREDHRDEGVPPPQPTSC